MQLAFLILGLIPTILRAVTAVETLYREAKAGEVKKTSVMRTLEVATDAAIAAGAPITTQERDEVLTGLGQAVDATVDALHAAGLFTHGAVSGAG